MNEIIYEDYNEIFDSPGIKTKNQRYSRFSINGFFWLKSITWSVPIWNPFIITWKKLVNKEVSIGIITHYFYDV